MEFNKETISNILEMLSIEYTSIKLKQDIEELTEIDNVYLAILPKAIVGILNIYYTMRGEANGQ